MLLNRAKRAYSATIDQNKNKTSVRKLSLDPGGKVNTNFQMILLEYTLGEPNPDSHSKVT